MAIQLETHTKIPVGLVLLIVVQVFCVIFFLSDLIADYRAMPPAGRYSYHFNIESLATACLVAAIAVEVRYLFQMLRRTAHLEKDLKVASAAVYDVIAAHFETWRLSPSERDVATFLVKGLDISEIARVRNCAEGTVKAHLNAIYRKSGARNRGELLSLLIDSLLAGKP